MISPSVFTESVAARAIFHARSKAEVHEEEQFRVFEIIQDDASLHLYRIVDQSFSIDGSEEIVVGNKINARIFYRGRHNNRPMGRPIGQLELPEDDVSESTPSMV